LKWLIVNRTRNCSELSGLREDIARDFRFINVGNREIKHCYMHTYRYFTVKCPCYANAASCRRRRENNLASTLKCVLNVESGIMQPSILLLSYMIQIPKISQGNVTRD